MIVDIHTHLWESPDQMGNDAAARIRGGLGDPWERSPEATIGVYDAAMQPVQCAIILGFVSQHIGADVPAEQIARYVKLNPSKYLGFAGIDPMQPHIRQNIDNAVSLGLVGVTISPPAQNFNPTHTRAMILYEKCQQLGLPVFIHPGSQLSPQSHLEYAQPHLFDEVARSFPKVKFIFAQLGHPFVEQTLVLMSKHPNIYADLSDIVGRPWELYNTLLNAYQYGVMNRLLLGSNFPFSTPEKAITAIYSVNMYSQGSHLPSVPREQLRSIVERDTLKCLGLTPPLPPAPARQTSGATVKGSIG